MRRTALALLMLSAWLLPLGAGEKALHPVTSEQWTRKYDGYFKKYGKRYFGPDFDWRWFKAQAIVESGLKPNAKGRSGSRGVMQMHPRTFRKVKTDNPHFLSLNDPHWNIAAGIYHDRTLFERWRDRQPLTNRICFMLASYNTSWERMSKAVARAARAGKSVLRWEEVAPFAPKSTRRYVEKVRRLMQGASVQPLEPEDETDDTDDDA
jgi:membrane-bound lytic murein transglycosylase MltF